MLWIYLLFSFHVHVYIFRNKTYYLTIKMNYPFHGSLYQIQPNIERTFCVGDFIFMIYTLISRQEKNKIFTLHRQMKCYISVLWPAPRNWSLYHIAYIKCLAGFQFQSQVSEEMFIGVFFWKYYIIVHFIILT